MEDLLISTLATLGYPVKRQGSILPDEPYPDHFFTFWNDSADGSSFYSNTENSILWAYTVNFYSINVSNTYSELMNAKTALINAGFTVTGGGFDVASDEVTHTGRGMEIFYRQNL